MTFGRPSLLYILGAVPILGLIIFCGYRQRNRALMLFAESELAEYLAGKLVSRSVYIKSICLLLGFSLMVVALADPMWGVRFEKLARRGSDVVFVLDVSPSMRAKDVIPNRLEAGKKKIIEILGKLTGSNAGFVIFSGKSFIRCPLTFDLDAVRSFVSSAEENMVPTKGTDIGSALENALRCFDYKTQSKKLILLVSDGEDNVGQGINMAKRAAEKGVEVLTLGVGERIGCPIPDKNSKGSFKRDIHGNMVITRLNELTLLKIARITGGTYVHYTTNDDDVRVLYAEGIKKSFGMPLYKGNKIRVKRRRFPLVLMLAFTFLLIEAVLPLRKKL